MAAPEKHSLNGSCYHYHHSSFTTISELLFMLTLHTQAGFLSPKLCKRRLVSFKWPYKLDCRKLHQQGRSSSLASLVQGDMQPFSDVSSGQNVSTHCSPHGLQPSFGTQGCSTLTWFRLPYSSPISLNFSWTVCLLLVVGPLAPQISLFTIPALLGSLSYQP